MSLSKSSYSLHVVTLVSEEKSLHEFADAKIQNNKDMEKLIKNYFCLIGNFDVARLEKNELCFNIRHDADARGFFASFRWMCWAYRRFDSPAMQPRIIDAIFLVLLSSSSVIQISWFFRLSLRSFLTYGYCGYFFARMKLFLKKP